MISRLRTFAVGLGLALAGCATTPAAPGGKLRTASK
jgi:hypothetical protein